MKILVLWNWPVLPSSHSYFKPQTDQVWYICDPAGIRYVQTYLGETDIQGISTVEDFDDADAVRDQIRRVHGNFAFERIVAIDEMTVLPAAVARDEFDIPGPRSKDVELYRDKRKMKQHLAHSGIRVIRDIRPELAGPPAPFAPCVIKEVSGAAARGVYVCHDTQEFERHRSSLVTGALLEEFVTGDFFHIDGALNEHGMAAMPHAYINNCYDHYVESMPLGSVGVSDPTLRMRLTDFAEHVLAILPLRECVFHLELVRTAADELVFLEIACRMGGGEIFSNFLDVYGLDLLGFDITSQLGLSPRLRKLRDREIAGWLKINKFTHRPGVFTALRCGPLAENNCMYAMRSYKIGRSVIASLRDDFVSFALRGASEVAVRASIDELISKVTLESVPIRDAPLQITAAI